VLSPIEALSVAWRETLRLLFRPWSGRRWIMLSVVCMFLGGGTSTAAFQWGLSTLPVDIHPAQILLRLRLILAERLSLIILAVTFILGLLLALLYARCVLRFVLVDAVIKQEVALGRGWRDLQPLGRAYFFWLVGVLSSLLLMASTVVVLSFPHLGSSHVESRPLWLASLLLVLALAVVVVFGLLVAVVIALTDDLVVPLIYAERTSLPAAWGKVWKVARRDTGTFIFYIALRFAVSMGISVAVLFFLFPVLMGLSSGAIIAAALVILALRAVGFAWAWNPVTTLLGIVALLLLTSLLFVLLSVAGMPGQVYLQNYGVRFIASRVPTLGALCRASSASGRRL
jgi:hypothetical protein